MITLVSLLALWVLLVLLVGCWLAGPHLDRDMAKAEKWETHRLRR